MIENIISIDRLIGKVVLSRTSGNALGRISDVFVEPVKGLMLGLIVQNANGDTGAIDYKDIYSFGQDAVMTQTDEVVEKIDEQRLSVQPLAKRNLFSANIFTESGSEIGRITNVLIHLAAPPFLIYEVRESVFDALLGRGSYILAEKGRAFSDDAKRIVVANEAIDNAATSLDEVIVRRRAGVREERHQSSEKPFSGNAVIVRTRGEEETEIREREQETVVSERENG